METTSSVRSSRYARTALRTCAKRRSRPHLQRFVVAGVIGFPGVGLYSAASSLRSKASRRRVRGSARAGSRDALSSLCISHRPPTPTTPTNSPPPPPPPPPPPAPPPPPPPPAPPPLHPPPSPRSLPAHPPPPPPPPITPPPPPPTPSPPPSPPPPAPPRPPPPPPPPTPASPPGPPFFLLFCSLRMPRALRLLRAETPAQSPPSMTATAGHEPGTRPRRALANPGRTGAPQPSLAAGFGCDKPVCPQKKWFVCVSDSSVVLALAI